MECVCKPRSGQALPAGPQVRKHSFLHLEGIFAKVSKNSHLMRDFMEQDGEGGEEPNLKIILKNVQFTLLFLRRIPV